MLFGGKIAGTDLQPASVTLARDVFGKPNEVYKSKSTHKKAKKVPTLEAVSRLESQRMFADKFFIDQTPYLLGTLSPSGHTWVEVLSEDSTRAMAKKLYEWKRQAENQGLSIDSLEISRWLPTVSS